MLNKNQEIQLTITDLSYEGMGVAHTEEGMTLFVDNALPGEVVIAKIMKLKKGFGFAKTMSIETKSPDRVEMVSNKWAQTGIAPLAHLTYDKQLEFKTKQVKTLVEKNKLDVDVLDTIASPNELAYRNKAQIPARQVNGQLEVGFFRKRSHDLVEMEDFLIQDTKIDNTIKGVRDILRRYDIAGYDEKNHRGQVKNVIVRRGYFTGEIMVILVCLDKKFKYLQKIADEIEQLEEVKSVYLNHNPQKTNVIMGKKNRLLAGNSYITDKIGDQTFMISPQSFFQINSSQTPTLYQKAVEMAQLNEDDEVLDTYSGIGTIGLSVAKKVKSVTGVEVVKSAVDDAKNNATLNHITNSEFFLGKSEEYMNHWAEEGKKATVVIADPPRKGVTSEFIQSTAKIAPRKVIYISCNPATLMRDIKEFEEYGYTTKTIQPVDMFPMTQHVECVTVLEKN